MQAIRVKTWFEYTSCRKNGQRPADIPVAPDKACREFEGWGKFLGTDGVANLYKECWSYEVAKKYLASLDIKIGQSFYDIQGVSKEPFYVSIDDSYVKFMSSNVNFHPAICLDLFTDIKLNFAPHLSLC